MCAEIGSILAEPEIKALFAGWGIEPGGGTAQAVGARIASEHQRWREFIGRSGLKLK